MQRAFSMTYLPLLISLRSLQTARLQPYLGNALHGVLGWALTARPAAYRYLYENRLNDGSRRDIPNPYVIDPPSPCALYRQGDVLRFRLLLVGDAAMCARDIIEALAQSESLNLGPDCRPFRLEEVLHGESLRPIWHGGALDLKEAVSVPLSADGFPCSRCAVMLQTPLRIRRNGALLEAVDFPVLLRNITQRLMQLTQRYGGEMSIPAAESVVADAAAVSMTSSGLWLCPLERYSSRHQKKMDMSGLMGTMTFQGELAPFVPWLRAAGLLHIGRNTTFGYGKLEAIFSPDAQ